SSMVNTYADPTQPGHNTAPIKLIASDLDGTLLRNDGTISERTRSAFRDAAEAGFAIVIASGRPPRTILPIAAQLDVEGLAVCSNGAILYDLGKQVVVGNEQVPQSLLLELVATLRDREPSICFAAEYGHRVGYEPTFPRTDTWIHELPPVVGDAHLLCAD